VAIWCFEGLVLQGQPAQDVQMASSLVSNNTVSPVGGGGVLSCCTGGHGGGSSMRTFLPSSLHVYLPLLQLLTMTFTLTGMKML